MITNIYNKFKEATIRNPVPGVANSTIVPDYFQNLGPANQVGTHLFPVQQEVVQKFGTIMELFQKLKDFTTGLKQAYGV